MSLYEVTIRYHVEADSAPEAVELAASELAADGTDLLVLCATARPVQEEEVSLQEALDRG